MTKEEFILECKKINIDITEEIFSKLDRYKELLIEWNQKFNLTTIIEEKDIFLKHFFDSLYLNTECDFKDKKICDIGTGAGFPGMVLAIVFKNGNFTLMESNNKKVLFLGDLGPEGGNGGGTIVCEGTPEEVAQVKESYTGQFLKEKFY